MHIFAVFVVYQNGYLSKRHATRFALAACLDDLPFLFLAATLSRLQCVEKKLIFG
jgi:hypothetical protein